MVVTTLREVALRAATPDDDPAVLDLLRQSMGWVPDEQHARFFDWKHRQNPHGVSPAWVAVDGDRVVGFRTFLRWRFTLGAEAREVRAVRAVDTATHPDYQGRGIFTWLTRHALEQLGDEAGTELVFNTPNQRSLPGYRKLGWQPGGRLPVAGRPRSLRTLLRVARARTPAGKWSAPSPTGRPAAEVLQTEADAIAELLRADRTAPGEVDGNGDGEGHGSIPAGVPRRPTLRTLRSPAHLRWRYGFPPLDYRAAPLSADPAEGLAIFRLRSRGPALEAVICEILLPTPDMAARRRLVRQLLRESGADHAVLLEPAQRAMGTLPIPGHGPRLVYRYLDGRSPSGPSGPSDPPSPPAWDLTLGDVELL